jgi:tetratricopeptide (TPR) repeat protein
MFRRNIYFQCGGYDKSFKYSQDYDLWLRMIKLTKPLNIDRYLYKLRIHNNSISIEHQSSQFQDAVKAITKNVCHAKIKNLFFSDRNCKCFVCNPKTKTIDSDIVNIVSARLLLRMGDYTKARKFYKKILSFEAIGMLIIIRFESVIKALKLIFSYSIK